MTYGAKPHSHRRNVESVYQFFKAFPGHVAASYSYRQHCLHAILTPFVALYYVRLHEELNSSVPQGFEMGNGSDGDQCGPKVTMMAETFFPACALLELCLLAETFPLPLWSN